MIHDVLLRVVGWCRRARVPSFLLALALAVSPVVVSAQIQDPLQGKCVDLADCIQNVVQYVLGLAGILALAGIVYGGFLYITAAGNQERVESGKNAVFYSIVGLIVIGLAFAIVTFVFNALGGGGGPPGGVPPGPPGGVPP